MKGKEYKLTFKIKEDPDFKEDVKLNFTSKTVVYGEKVGQFPYATRKDHILVWYDKDGKRVNSETVYLVEGDSTYTGSGLSISPLSLPATAAISLCTQPHVRFHRLHRRRCHPAPPPERRVIRGRRSTE